jgi:hypothetical protein
MIDRKPLIGKYAIVGGKQEGAQLKRTFRAGEAYLHEGDDYYVVKLVPFPFAYYLKKNHESETNYTIFAKRVEQRESTILRDPIGLAFLGKDLRTHLEIKIPLLRLHLFMNLYPV